MTIHQNHCWLTNVKNPNNEDGSFDGRVMVYFEDKMDNDFIRDNELGYCLSNPDMKLVSKHEYFSQDEYDKWVEIEIELKDYKNKSEIPENKLERLKKRSMKTGYKFNKEVLEWLEENYAGKYGIQEYMDKPMLIFLTPRPARNFIKQFSVFKQPVFDFNYFNDTRKDIKLSKFLKILENLGEIETVKKIKEKL
jgi:hypothetical protein